MEKIIINGFAFDAEKIRLDQDGKFVKISYCEIQYNSRLGREFVKTREIASIHIDDINSVIIPADACYGGNFYMHRDGSFDAITFEYENTKIFDLLIH